jgi:hypothetical protein
VYCCINYTNLNLPGVLTISIISKNTKILMYKVLIRSVVTYASETWTDSKANEWRLGLFERKVLRCIFGAKQENEIWQKRYNYELYKIFNDSDVVNYIKVKRLVWAGHLMFMGRALDVYGQGT